MGRGRKMFMRENFSHQASRAGVHVPSERGTTMKPSRAVGPRRAVARHPGGDPLQPKGLAAKTAHLVGSVSIPVGGKASILLVPKEYPYFTAQSANVDSNVDIVTKAYVGQKLVQGLKVGFQKVNWPPGSTTGLARETRVVIYNHGKTTAKVKIDLSVMPMDHL